MKKVYIVNPYQKEDYEIIWKSYLETLGIKIK